jgi:hypothetical protein
MTFDIEGIVDRVQGDSLDFDMFCKIFQQEREGSEDRIASAASQRTFTEESVRSVVVDERDFQRFLAQY